MAEDFLLCAKWILPVEPARALEDHAIAVRGNAIEALLPAGAAQERYPDLERIELPEHAVIPGLVNAHVSVAVAPASEDAALRACAEMLAGGITCLADTCLFPEAALGAARAAGMRAMLGILAADTASAYAADFDDYLRKGLALRDRAREEPLASFFLAPLAAHMLSKAQLRHVAALAAELDLPVQIRLREADQLGELDLLDPRLAVVQGAQASSRDIELLARHGCSLVLCPSSGPAPAAGLPGAGVNLALGTAAALAKPRLDLFQEMRLAAAAAGADAGIAQAVLRAGTLGGAHALGLDEVIGSIAPGKQADFAAIDLRAPWHPPAGDPVSWITRAAGRDNVSRVWVAGRLVFTRGTAQNGSFPLLASRGGLS